MAEYQFYEFLAIDRPLTNEERKFVSSLSSRTEASLYGATFVYHYGGGISSRIDNLMAKYFDAMLYIANWGSARLMFRFPAGAVDIELLQAYEFENAVIVATSGDFVILDMNYNQEEPFPGWIEGEGLLAQMVGLRQAILNGDMRALFLAWLQTAQIESQYEWTSTEDFSPVPIPYNLDKSSRELKVFADFFCIEEAVVKAAAKLSPDYERKTLDIDTTLSLLSANEKDYFLKKLVNGVPGLQATLLKRLRELQSDGSAPPEHKLVRIETILEKVDEATAEIEVREQEKLNKYLDGIAAKASQMWDEIYMLIGQKQVKAYEKAIEHLVELKKLAKHDGALDTFNLKIRDIYDKYPTLKGLHSRMRHKGL